MPTPPIRQRATGRVTLADVALAAGVSPITVSRALRGERAVAPELVERVQAAAAKLGYVPADAVRSTNQRLQQAELRSILREAVKRGTEGSAVNCEELIRYKGHWIMPNDPVARGMVDRKVK